MTKLSELYEVDELEWAQRNIELLQNGRVSEIDAEHIVQVLEDISKRERRELYNRVVILLMHLLKWKYQTEKRSASWETTIKEQRRQVRMVLKDYPSLGPFLVSSFAECYREALEDAILETGLSPAHFPRDLFCSIDEMLNAPY